MLLRIVEFQEPNDKGDCFFVEQGKKVWEIKTVFRIPISKVIWSPVKKEIPLSADKIQRTEIIGHKTYDEAVLLIDELKKQIPIYHRIL